MAKSFRWKALSITKQYYLLVILLENSTVTQKGQVTIPISIRKILGIKSGEKVVFDIEAEKVVLRKAPKNPIEDMVGLGKGIFGNSIEYQRKAREEWE